MTPLSEYLEASEPTRRERAENWRVAIGLQIVDGLEVSPYLIETARRNVEGEISAEEARRIVRQYYEEKPPGADPEAHGEADHTSTNINAILAEPSFRLSPEYFIGLHRRIFEDVFPFAGQLRTVDITNFSYLHELRFKGVTNEPFAEHAWFFRNALVRANYRNPIQGISKTTEPLISFFRNILFGEQNPLKNRLRRIGPDKGGHWEVSMMPSP